MCNSDEKVVNMNVTFHFQLLSETISIFLGSFHVLFDRHVFFMLGLPYWKYSISCRLRGGVLINYNFVCLPQFIIFFIFLSLSSSFCVPSIIALFFKHLVCFSLRVTQGWYVLDCTWSFISYNSSLHQVFAWKIQLPKKKVAFKQV